MLYELLAGERPFEGASEAEILAKLLTGRCAPLTECAPSTPAELVAIVERLMAPEAEARFASASDARQALAAWPGYPADGADVLAVWVARTLAGRDSEAPIAPTQPPPLAAGTPQPETRATRTRYRPSMRTLVVLSVLAALSVTAAITVWVVPIGGKHPAAPAGPPAQVERASALPPPPPAPTTPAGPAAAPSSATPVPRAAASPPAVPPPSPPGVDAGPAPSDDPPRKRGKAWEIERGAESPDVVPR
jgi:hypothetical protein